MPQFIDLTGCRFGKLTAVERVDTHSRKVRWRCVCECGGATEHYTFALRKGVATHCGCIPREGAEFKGASNHPLYCTWKSMRERCFNPAHKMYQSYGGRGITICSEWNGFAAFIGWAERAEWTRGLTLDRIDVNGDYEPSNCRWIPKREQYLNMRKSRYVQFNGQRVNYLVAARALGLNPRTVYLRLYHGEPEEKALAPTNRG